MRGHWDCAVVSEYDGLDQGISKGAALSAHVGVKGSYEDVEVHNEKDGAAGTSLGRPPSRMKDSFDDPARPAGDELALVVEEVANPVAEGWGAPMRENATSRSA